MKLAVSYAGDDWCSYFSWKSLEVAEIDLADVRRFGKFDTKASGFRYVAELASGHVVKVIVTHQTPEVQKFLKPVLKKVPTPICPVRVPPALRWGEVLATFVPPVHRCNLCGEPVEGNRPSNHFECESREQCNADRT
jgi:hypothetical protein